MLLYEVQSTARKKTRITYEDKFACTKGYLPVLCIYFTSSEKFVPILSFSSFADRQYGSCS